MSNRWTPYVVLMAMPLFFVSNLIIGRAAVMTVPPWTLAFLRWLLACLILAPFVCKMVRVHAPAIRAEWRSVLLLGFLGMWISGAIVYVSLQVTTATHATLIYTVSPALVVLLAAVIARRPLPLSQAFGVLLGVAGVAVIVLEGDFTSFADMDFNLGDLGMVAAALSWAIYSLVLKRPAFDAIPTFALFFAIAVAGTLTLLPFMIHEVATQGRFPASASSWLSVFGLALIPSVLAFSSYQYGVRTVGPAITSVYMYLLPPYGVALAIIFLGERLQAYHWIGFALVLGGVVLATGSELRPRSASRR